MWNTKLGLIILLCSEINKSIIKHQEIDIFLPESYDLIDLGIILQRTQLQ